MKHLNEFISFDFMAWVEGKDFQVVSVNGWEDRETGKSLGKIVETVILRDDCKAYKLKDGEEFDLVYEKVVFKVLSADGIHKGDKIDFVNPRPVIYVNNGFINVSFKADAIIKKSGEGGKKS